jgi:hypothetical protein
LEAGSSSSSSLTAALSLHNNSRNKNMAQKVFEIISSTLTYQKLLVKNIQISKIFLSLILT